MERQVLPLHLSHLLFSFFFLLKRRKQKIEEMKNLMRRMLPKKSGSWNLSVRRICPRVPTSRIIGNRVSEVLS